MRPLLEAVCGSSQGLCSGRDKQRMARSRRGVRRGAWCERSRGLWGGERGVGKTGHDLGLGGGAGGARG